LIAAFAGFLATVGGAIGPVLLAAVAVAVVAGGVAATSSRDGRLATVGLAVALTAAPFVASPLPEARGLAARVVGALLTVYLLVLVERTGPTRTAGTHIGWAAEALVAGTVAVAGLGAAAGLSTTLAGVGVGPAGGPALSQFQPFGPAVGAGLSLIVLAVGPVIFARDAIALGVGVLLATNGVLLIRAGIDGPPSGFEELTSAALMVTVGAATAVIVRAATATSGELRDPALADGEDLVDRDWEEDEEEEDEEEEDGSAMPVLGSDLAAAETLRRVTQAPHPGAPTVAIWPELAAPVPSADAPEPVAIDQPGEIDQDAGEPADTPGPVAGELHEPAETPTLTEVQAAQEEPAAVGPASAEPGPPETADADETARSTIPPESSKDADR
jgi:hypothetical protein